MQSPDDIRRATPADIDDLAPLFDAYRMFFAKKSELERSRTFLLERLQRDESVVFVAGKPRDARGFIQLYPLFSSWYCARIWFVSDLYVAETAREAGCATRLVRAAQAFAQETSAASMMVEIPHSEPHLMRFYERLGFGKDPIFDLYRQRISGGSLHI